MHGEVIMKVSTNQVMLLDAKELFAPLHRLKLGTGNRATTVCISAKK